MGYTVKKDSTSIREVGHKLANFRKKLALAINQKKITQGAFGEMYGGYSGRAVASYELGDVDPPATLLYLLWKSGHSIDTLFSEGPITENGRTSALHLYENSTTANLTTMDANQRRRLLREAIHVKSAHDTTTQEAARRTSGKRKTGTSAPGKTKKR